MEQRKGMRGPGSGLGGWMSCRIQVGGTGRQLGGSEPKRWRKNVALDTLLCGERHFHWHGDGRVSSILKTPRTPLETKSRRVNYCCQIARED